MFSEVDRLVSLKSTLVFGKGQPYPSVCYVASTGCVFPPTLIWSANSSGKVPCKIPSAARSTSYSTRTTSTELTSSAVSTSMYPARQSPSFVADRAGVQEVDVRRLTVPGLMGVAKGNSTRCIACPAYALLASDVSAGPLPTSSSSISSSISSTVERAVLPTPTRVAEA